MLPLTLPISTEINMQNLMYEASISFDSGKLKTSYELYIEALLSAIKELQQLQFNKNQCVIQQQNNKENNISSIFVLAQTCLRHAKDIALSNSNSKRKPPNVPPKPTSLSIPKKQFPPPLPIRPSHLNTAMTRTRSDFVKTSTCDTIDNSDDEEEEEVDHYHSQQKQHKQTSLLKQQYKKKNKLKRRSSTSNISCSAPSSPLATTGTIAANKLNVVKSFLSIPNAMATHTVLDGDDIFLLSNSTIDPNILITVQTSYSDNSLQSTTSTNNYLPMIPQAPLVTVYQSLQKKLDILKKTDEQFNSIQSLLNRVRNIHMSATTVPTILQFQPVLIAYQLTLIDSTIFRNITMDAILSHSPKTPHPTIVASTDFFNYLTRLIEHAILLQQDASCRAQHINHWIKVAGKCHELKNYQTLKAIISSLGTPPIQRLKRSWSFIPKKSMNLLEDLSELMSEASNYGKYRTRLGLSQEIEEEQDISTTVKKPNQNSNNTITRKNSFGEPTVPFLGIFIHDMTYLIAALSKKKPNNHNSQWKSTNEESSNQDIDIQQDVRVCELLKLFKNLQRSPPYSPNLSTTCIKDLTKNRKRKLSHALTRTSAIKKTPAYFSNQHDDETGGELSTEMQQCLVTQYLLTRSWVSEKTVDELSLVREPTKRSFSVTDSLAATSNAITTPTSTALPPPITSSVSLTTTARSSSGSLTSSSSNSRPLSLDDDLDEELLERKSSTGGGFWLFGRKSVDQGHLKSSASNDQFGTLQRSPRHFSFEELSNASMVNKNNNALKKQQSSLSIDSTIKMQREGSQNSLASSIFRKDFWKNNSNNATTTATAMQQTSSSSNSTNSGRNPLLSFNSDPSMITAGSIQRKGSTNSFIHPSPSTSSDTQQHLHQYHQHNMIRKYSLTTSPHPLDNSPSLQSELSLSGFQWDP